MKPKKSTKKNDSTSWGGKRQGAGRKPLGDKKAIDTTKVVRVSMSDYDRIKSGRYDDMMNLLFEYRSMLETSKGAKTSPRWQKLRDFMKEAEEIFGSDYNSWNS